MSRIAVVQMQTSTLKTHNLETSVGYIKEAKKKGCNLIAFPEFLMAYSPSTQTPAELSRIAESLGGEFASQLSRAAKAHRIDVVATLYEKSKIKNKVYDTAIFIDKNGKLISAYRKLHLYDALGFRESAKLAPGRELVKPIDNKLGNIGLMICYDVRFPEMSRMLAILGADILVIPSAWVRGANKIEHWETMVRARAIENGCFVVAPDQVGNIYVGHSLVVDPFGKILLDMKRRKGLGIVEIDNGLVRFVRQRLPLLKHRRREIYSKYFK